MPAGRPEMYTEELVVKLLTKISTTSFSLKTICSEEGMPSVTTVIKWLNNNQEFALKYARAKEEQADLLIEEMIEISDDGTNDFMTIVKGDESYEQENKEWTSRSKLRVDTRKWIASKLKPKKYGDKLTQEIGGIDGNPIAVANEHRVIFEDFSGSAQTLQPKQKEQEEL